MYSLHIKHCSTYVFSWISYSIAETTKSAYEKAWYLLVYLFHFQRHRTRILHALFQYKWNHAFHSSSWGYWRRQSHNHVSKSTQSQGCGCNQATSEAPPQQHSLKGWYFDVRKSSANKVDIDVRSKNGSFMNLKKGFFIFEQHCLNFDSHCLNVQIRPNLPS